MNTKRPCPYCGRLYTTTFYFVGYAKKIGTTITRDIEDHACPKFRTEPVRYGDHVPMPSDRNSVDGLARYRSYLDGLYRPAHAPDDVRVSLTRPCIKCGRKGDHAACTTRKVAHSA